MKSELYFDGAAYLEKYPHQFKSLDDCVGQVFPDDVWATLWLNFMYHGLEEIAGIVFISEDSHSSDGEGQI